ncbi:hypothetical protein D3C78_1283030 [compost metagenome]
MVFTHVRVAGGINLGIVIAAALGHGEHVVLELGQLARAVQGGCVDAVWRIALGIAVRARLQVQHELRQRAVQAGNGAAHEREARARQLGGHVEIQAQRFADGDVVARLERKRGRVAVSTRFTRQPAADLDVVVSGFAQGHTGVRQVRHRHQQVVKRRLQGGQLFFQLLQANRHRLRFRHDGAGVFALGLELTDLLGQRVAAGLQGLGFGLDGLAAGLQVVEPFRVEGHAAGLEAVYDGLQVFAQQYRV